MTSDKTTIPVLKAKCPSCSKRAVLQYRPFCSKRCADLDLGNWLNGSYAVPVVEEDGSISEEDGD